MILLDISSWWAGIESLVEKAYWIVAFPATLIFLLQTIMTLVGADTDTDTDTDFDIDAGFHVFTVKNIIAFFSIFSWTGIAVTQAGMPPILTGILAIGAGTIMMLIMASLFYFMSKLSDSGTLEMDNAIGKTARVYLTIAPNKSRKGKVQITIQNSMKTIDALTEDPEEIKTGSMVEVEEVLNNQILIVKRKR